MKFSTRIPILTSLLLSSCIVSQDTPDIDLSLGGDKSDGYTVVDPGSCPDGAPRLVNGARAAWTIIHYAAADNDLESVLLQDINEMELGHQGSSNVNILVQLDKRSETGVWRYEIQPDSDKDKINSRLIGHSDEEPDSGDWRTLAAYGRWAATCYPAENFMVIVGGHGGGWSTEKNSTDPTRRAGVESARKKGETYRNIAPDFQSGSRMYVNELAMALEAIQESTKQPNDPPHLNRLVAYGSDACLMSTVEVAYDLRNAVRYIVGSEESEPGEGWPYSTIIRSLTSRPWYYSNTPSKFMDSIVDSYARSYDTGGAAESSSMVTLAAIDTGAVQRSKNKLRTFSTLLQELLSEKKLNESIQSVRENMDLFGDGYVDLGYFIRELKKQLLAKNLVPAHGQSWSGDEKWRTLRETMDELTGALWKELVPAFRSSERFQNTTGLSVFFPENECYTGLDLDGYFNSQYSKDTNWGSFLEGYLTSNRSEASSNIAPEAAGAITVRMGGTTLEYPVTCFLASGTLNVNYSCFDGDCEDMPLKTFSALLDIEQEKLVPTTVFLEKTGAELSEFVFGEDIVASETIVSTASYAGTLDISLPDEKIQVIFECTDFKIDYCPLLE